MAALYRYLLIMIACGTLLAGVQVPNFVDQYLKRVNAHLLEVDNNLAPYRQIADDMFGGNLKLLLARHQASSDPAFVREAAPLQNMMARYARFTAERAAMDTDLVRQVMHLVVAGDRQMIKETVASYTWGIPLDRVAITSGFVTVALSILLIECLVLLGRLLVSRVRASSRV